MLWIKPVLVEVERNWKDLCVWCVEGGWGEDGCVFLECGVVEGVRHVNISKWVKGGRTQGHGWECAARTLAGLYF